MHSNLMLISKKWKKPAISLTGGCDSKTTLACAKGLYDRFEFFSYSSTEAEEVDAAAAAAICDSLNIRHRIYKITDRDVNLDKIQAVSEIINWNTGDILYSHKSDILKRIQLADSVDLDVEVKSWVSEIGRAYYSKRFHNRKNFGPRPTARKCTTLYKFFLHNRRLVLETDRVFGDYLKKYFSSSPDHPVEWQDQFFWEYRVPSWNGPVITGEQKYSFDITIPYNNRRILELLLSASLQSRMEDSIYKAVRDKMNPEIDKTGIFITNLKHTKKRALLEDIYYLLNTRFMI